MENDRLADYLRNIKTGVGKWRKDLDIIMVVVAQKQLDVYHAVQQITLVQLGIPLQV